MNLGRILVAEYKGAWVVKFTGDIRMTLCTTIEACLDDMFSDATFQSVVIDLTETQGIDSTSLGLLAKLSIKTKERIGVVPTIVSTNEDVTRVLLSMGFKDRVFSIVTEALDDLPKLTILEELPAQNCDEKDAQQKVLEAHKILMYLNNDNREKFQDLVAALEQANKSNKALSKN